MHGLAANWRQYYRVVYELDIRYNWMWNAHNYNISGYTDIVETGDWYQCIMLWILKLITIILYWSSILIMKWGITDDKI